MFLPAHLSALTKNGFLLANEGVLVALSYKMRTNILKRGLLRIISDCAVDLVPTSLTFACAGEIDCIVPDCLGWFLYDFADATITSAS